MCNARSVVYLLNMQITNVSNGKNLARQCLSERIFIRFTCTRLQTESSSKDKVITTSNYGGNQNLRAASIWMRWPRLKRSEISVNSIVDGFVVVVVVVVDDDVVVIVFHQGASVHLNCEPVVKWGLLLSLNLLILPNDKHDAVHFVLVVLNSVLYCNNTLYFMTSYMYCETKLLSRNSISRPDKLRMCCRYQNLRLCSWLNWKDFFKSGTECYILQQKRFPDRSLSSANGKLAVALKSYELHFSVLLLEFVK